MGPYSRIRETTTSTSSSVITLAGAALGYRAFSLKHAVGETGIEVVIDDGSGNWLEGLYTMTDATTLTRTSIISSSNADADVTFAAGTKAVFETITGASLRRVPKTVTDTSGNVLGLVKSDGFLVDPISLGVNDGNRYLPGIPVLKQPVASELNTTNGVNVTGAGTGTIVTRNGVRCVEIMITAAGIINVFKKLPASWQADNYGGHMQMTYELEDVSGLAGGYAQLGIYTDGTFTVGVKSTVNIGSGNGFNGVHVHTPQTTSPASEPNTFSDWAAVSTGTLASVMTYTLAKFNTIAAGIGKRIWVYSIVGNERRALPSVYIGADDGHGSWYDYGLPMLEKYGLRGYQAFIRDFAETGRSTGNSMSIAEWQDMVARGHEAVVHGPRRVAPAGSANAGLNLLSLRDYFTAANLSPGQTTYDAALADINWNRDGLGIYGLDPTGRGRNFYVLPQGFHQPSGGYGDPTILSALTTAGIRVCRLAANNLGATGFTAGPSYARQSMFLPIIGHNNQLASAANETANISNLIAIMQSEIAKGRSVIFMFHQIILTGTPTVKEQILQSNLELICAAIAALINSGQAQNGSMQSLVPRFAVEGAKAIA